VEFVQKAADGSFDLVVWERGVGRTLACGTGAVATGAHLCLAGLAPFGEPFQIRLPGGPLTVWVTEGTLAVRFKGPARRVFSGEVA
jgi:diaminopimelate epimerase